jgi:hypothetical protein
MKNIIGLKGNRNETKRKLKQKFATLTEGLLVLLEGKPEEMFVRVPVKLVKTKEEIHKLTL